MGAIPNGDVFLSTTRRYTAITSASPFRMGFTNAGYNHGSRYERVPPRAQDYWKKLQQSDVTTFLRLIPPFPPPQPPDSPNAIIASEAALPIQPLPSSERPYGAHPRKGLPRS